MEDGRESTSGSFGWCCWRSCRIGEYSSPRLQGLHYISMSEASWEMDVVSLSISASNYLPPSFPLSSSSEELNCLVLFCSHTVRCWDQTMLLKCLAFDSHSNHKATCKVSQEYMNKLGMHVSVFMWNTNEEYYYKAIQTFIAYILQME